MSLKKSQTADPDGDAAARDAAMMEVRTLAELRRWVQEHRQAILDSSHAFRKRLTLVLTLVVATAAGAVVAVGFAAKRRTAGINEALVGLRENARSVEAAQAVAKERAADAEKQLAAITEALRPLNAQAADVRETLNQLEGFVGGYKDRAAAAASAAEATRTRADAAYARLSGTVNNVDAV